MFKTYLDAITHALKDCSKQLGINTSICFGDMSMKMLCSLLISHECTRTLSKPQMMPSGLRSGDRGGHSTDPFYQYSAREMCYPATTNTAYNVRPFGHLSTWNNGPMLNAILAIGRDTAVIAISPSLQVNTRTAYWNRTSPLPSTSFRIMSDSSLHYFSSWYSVVS
jgi:hypothetical protein